MIPSIRNHIARILRSFWKNFSDFCENTVLPGFKFIGDSSIPIWERLYFLTSVLIILIYVIALTTNIYAKWDGTPIIVGYTPNPILINKIPFPTVTICNVNQARASKVRNISRTSVEYSMLQTLCTRSVDHKNPETLADIKNRTSFQQFIEEVAQPCGQLFLSCKFAKIEKNCEDIFRPIFTDEGQCCSFNLAHFSFIHRIPRRMDSLVQKDGAKGVDWNPETGYQEDLPKMFYPRLGAGTGISSGLSIVVNVESNDYYCASTNGPGFKLLLHNAVEVPSLRENGLYVSVGAETTFRIAADRSEATQNIRSFKIDERQCVFNSERELGFYKIYTRRNCELECQANMTAKLCGCITFFLPRTWTNVSVCSLKQQDCVQQVLHWKPESSSITGQQSCIDLCIQGCFDLSYIPDKFSIPLTEGGYMIKDSSLEEFNTTYLKNNIAVVHFYYKLSHFAGFMRTRYIGTTEFISNTGGLIGLLGFSFISVAEIVYFLVLRSLRNLGLRAWTACGMLKDRIKGSSKPGQRSKIFDRSRFPEHPRNSKIQRFPKSYRAKMVTRISDRH